MLAPGVLSRGGRRRQACAAAGGALGAEVQPLVASRRRWRCTAAGTPCPVRSNDATAVVAGADAPAPVPPAPKPPSLPMTGLGVPLVPGLLTALGLIEAGFLLVHGGRRRS